MSSVAFRRENWDPMGSDQTMVSKGFYMAKWGVNKSCTTDINLDVKCVKLCPQNADFPSFLFKNLRVAQKFLALPRKIFSFFQPLDGMIYFTEIRANIFFSQKTLPYWILNGRCLTINKYHPVSFLEWWNTNHILTPQNCFYTCYWNWS